MTALLLASSFAQLTTSTLAGAQALFDKSAALDKIQQYQTTASDDTASQIAAAQSSLAQLVNPESLTLYPQIRSRVQEYSLEATGETFRLAASPDQPPASFFTVEEGSSVFPDSATGVLISTHDAQQHEIELGSVLSLTVPSGEHLLTVTGIYEPLQPESGYWTVSPAVSSGSGELTSFPLFFAEDRYSQIFGYSALRLTFLASPAGMNPAAIAALSENLDRLHSVLQATEQFSHNQGVSVGGELFASVTELNTGLVSVQAVNPIPIILIALFSLLALQQLSNLLIANRRQETVLLKTRGFSAGRLKWFGFGEASLAITPAALAGAAVALPVFQLTTGISLSIIESLIIGGSVAALGILAMTIATNSEADRSLSRESATDSGRNTTAMTAASLILLGLATGVSLWQFKLNGSPLVTVNGSKTVDILSFLAPILLLISLVLLGLAIISPLNTFLARLSQGSRSVIRFLSTQQVARRLKLFAVPFTLISLATAGIVFSAGYSGTWATITHHQAALITPTGNKIVRPSLLMRPNTVDGLSQAPEITGATVGQALLLTAEYNRIPIELLGIPRDYAALVSDEASIPGDESLRELADFAPASILNFPGGTESLEFSLSAEQQLEERWSWQTGELISAAGTVGIPVTLDLWLMNEQDEVAFLRSTSRETVQHHRFELPTPGSEWKVIAITLRATVDQYASKSSLLWRSLQLTAVSATTVPLPELFEQGEIPITPLPNSGTGAHYIFSTAAESSDIIVSEALAQELGLSIGETFTFSVNGASQRITGTITDILPTIPGTSLSNALAVSLASFQQQAVAKFSSLPQTNQLWLNIHDPETAKPGIQNFLVTHPEARLIDTTEHNPLLSSSVAINWFGSIGILFLSIVGLLSTTRVLASSRRQEVPVLRALGVSAATQARIRRREVAQVTILALVIGAGIGAAVTALTVPELVLSTVLQPAATLDTSLRFDLAGALPLGAAFLLAITLVIFLHGLTIKRQALDRDYREETR